MQDRQQNPGCNCRPGGERERGTGCAPQAGSALREFTTGTEASEVTVETLLFVTVSPLFLIKLLENKQTNTFLILSLNAYPVTSREHCFKHLLICSCECSSGGLKFLNEFTSNFKKKVSIYKVSLIANPVFLLEKAPLADGGLQLPAFQQPGAVLLLCPAV